MPFFTGMNILVRKIMWMQYTYMFILNFCRRDRLSVIGTHQFPSINFSNGKVQTRPPYTVQFQYSFSGCEFSFSVFPVHTIPDTKSTHTTREEINNLRTNLNDFLGFPCCASQNAIILGDFNQVRRYVLSNFRSDLDEDDDITPVPYEGSSSALTNDPTNQLDRCLFDTYLKVHTFLDNYACSTKKLTDIILT